MAEASTSDLPARKPIRLRPGLCLTAILLLFVALGIAYSLATPIFEASDEMWHYPVVKHIADGHGLPRQDAGVATLWHQEGSQPPLYYLLAAGLTFWIDTSDLPEVRQPNPHAIVGQPLVVGNKNMMIHTDRENWPWRGSVLAVHLIRLLSVALGATTVWLTWRIAAQLWPHDSSIPLLAAALTAFNPMFLFISASVNNDNLAAPLAAGCVLLTLQAAQRGFSRRISLCLGVLLGLAALSKLSALAVGPLIAAALIGQASRQRNWYTLVNCGLSIAIPAAVIAGWWYGRNWSLYGDPTGLSRMLEIIGRRDEPLTWQGWWAEFEGFRLSYWALFGGVNILVDRWIYWLLDAVVGLGLLGIALTGLGRLMPGLRSRLPGLPGLPTALLTAWVALVFVSLLRWTAQTYASQGRLMFVAIAGISALVAAGLGALVPARWRPWLATTLTSGLLMLAAACLVLYIAPAYARPAPLTRADLPSDMQPVNWDINGQMRLLGYRLDQLSVHPAERLPVTIYWQALAPMQTNYSVFVKLLGRDRQVVGQLDTYPGLGAWPTRLLKPGDIIADTYQVPIAAEALAPSRLRIHVGLYRYEEPGRPGLVTVDASGRPVEPWLASAKLVPWQWPQVEPTHRLEVKLGQAIALIGYDLDQQLTLYWQASGRPDADYTVFIQVWDRQRQLAGFDSQPLNGDYPTSWWAVGETIVDPHALDLSQLPGGEYRLLVGLYRLDTGERLPALGPQGPLPDNAIELTSIRHGR